VGLVPKEASAKKVSYIWLKAKEGDKAFSGEVNDGDREATIDNLKQMHYEVKIFEDSEFLPFLKKDRTPIDLLIISGHGSTQGLQDLRVMGNRIVHIANPLFFLTDRKHHLMGALSSLLSNGSVVILDACLTGNKSLETNAARIFSLNLPQSTVYASQSLTRCEPVVIFDYAEEGSEDQYIIKNIRYASGKFGETQSAVKYRNGCELSQEPAQDLPEAYRPRPPQKPVWETLAELAETAIPTLNEVSTHPLAMGMGFTVL
ncbi:MAG: hypothetical protein AB7G16_08345, partial [Simkaniaceae bacterium]